MKREEFSKLIDAIFEQNMVFGSLDKYKIEFWLLTEGSINLDLANLVNDFHFVRERRGVLPALSEMPKTGVSEYFHSIRMEYFKPLLNLASTQEGKEQISHLFASNEHKRQFLLSVVKQWKNTLEYIKAKGTPITIENKLIHSEEKFMAATHTETDDEYILFMYQVTESSTDNLLVKKRYELPNGTSVSTSSHFITTYRDIYELLSNNNSEAIIQKLAQYMSNAMEAKALYDCEHYTARGLLNSQSAPDGELWDDAVAQISDKIDSSRNETIRAISEHSNLARIDVLELAVETGFLERSEKETECYLVTNSLSDLFEHNLSILELGTETIQRKIKKPNGSEYSRKYIENRSSDFRSENGTKKRKTKVQ